MIQKQKKEFVQGKGLIDRCDSVGQPRYGQSLSFRY